MGSAWTRLSLQERQLLCQVAALVPGAAHVELRDMDEKQVAALTRAMRFMVALADECRFALAYTRNSAREGAGSFNGSRK